MNPIQPAIPWSPIILPDHETNPTDFTAFRGMKRPLSFHPLAWTSVGHPQMEALTRNHDILKTTRARASRVSVDPVRSRTVWAQRIGVEKTRLLSDFRPRGAVSRTLGLSREALGISKRAAIRVDEEGLYQFVEGYPIGKAPDINGL